MKKIDREISRDRAFSCAACGEKVRFSTVLVLNNNTCYECKNCKTVLVPEKMSPAYFAITFIITAATGNILMKRYDSFLLIMIGAALAGFTTYLIGVIYTYKTILFKIKP